MRTVPFFIVDVFGEKKYQGNQLAVFLDAESLSKEEMQAMAKEIHFSESTFVLSREKSKGGYDVRIFTPDFEVPFAGHPTLGTAFVIHREIDQGLSGSVSLNLGVGQIPVTLESGGDLWMEQKAPQFGRKVDSKAISEILSIDESDVDDRFPVWEVSTGLPSIIVPLRTMDAVKRCRVNLERFMEFVREAFSANILVFSKETLFEENDLHARVFADDAGIPEDAATGSANGNLAGYLLETGYFGNDQLNYRVEQGYEMGRPSLLKVKAGKANGKYDIRVGGRVITVAKGDWIVE